MSKISVLSLSILIQGLFNILHKNMTIGSEVLMTPYSEKKSQIFPYYNKNHTHVSIATPVEHLPVGKYTRSLRSA